jgi:hypothetical protein
VSALAQCPLCGREIAEAGPDGMVACECGYHGYLGYLQEYAHLTNRQRWLWDRIQNQEPPPAEPLATQYGVWRVAPSTPPAKVSGGSTQLLLVGLGAVLVLLSGIVFVAVAWELIGPYGQLAALTLATIAFAVVALLSRRRTPRTAEALAVVAFGLAAITAVAAPAFGLVPEEWTRARYPYWLLVTGVLFGFGVLAGRRARLQAWTWLGWLTAPLVLATALGLVLTRLGNDEVDMTVAAIAFLALACVLFLAGRPPQTVAAAVSLVPAVALTLALLPQTPPAGAILVIAAALLVLLLSGDGAWREWLGWPLFAFWLALLASWPPASVLISALVALVGGVLLFGLVTRGPLLAVASAWTLWSAWLLIRGDDVSLVLGIAAVLLFALSWRKTAAPVAWVAALAGEVALLIEWNDPPFFEAPLLAFAGLLALAGALQWHAGSRRSALVVAPAVSMALIPSALLSWVDVWSAPSLVRFLVVLVIATVLLVAGVHWHILGLVVPSAIAIGVAATAQVFATLDLLPRWLALALVGGVLILVGARLEWLRERRRDTQEWLQSLQ